MRPNTTESLLCLKRVLAGIVRPVVNDAYALTQLAHADLALQDLVRCWADEIPNLMQAIDELTLIIADARASIADGPAVDERQSMLGVLNDALGIARRPATRYPNYDDLVERHTALRAAGEALIPFLSRHDQAMEAGPLRARLRIYMREQMDRMM
jgi:hypothetical protein